ncbi:hypothetical protein I547_5486 [Mycobacterium kansasii 824]|nr:hypothetical protein I547_5486 [Mycobacterium kansasii 824]
MIRISLRDNGTGAVWIGRHLGVPARELHHEHRPRRQPAAGAGT